VITGTIDILAEAVADRPDLAAIAGLAGILKPGNRTVI